MNRPIKFRVWDKQRNLFVEPNILCLLLKEETLLAYNTKQGAYPIPDTGQENLGVNRFVLQQFTGLKDKNGCEVYEGDIIQLTDQSRGVVVFDFGRFYHTSSSNTKITGLLYWNEVVGNIFENSDLIKK